MMPPMTMRTKRGGGAFLAAGMVCLLLPHGMATALSMTTTLSAAASSLPLRRVVVTGANKGIGRALCKKILQDVPDAFVYLGSRDAARGGAAVAEILEEVGPAAEGRLQALALDVTSDASVQAAAAQVAADCAASSLYGLINNAGVGFGLSIPATLEVNLYGARRVSEAFVPLLDLEEGRVVNIASASGPNFVSRLGDKAEQDFWADPSCLPTWEELEAKLAPMKAAPDYDGVAYGLSKASLNVYTQQCALAHPTLRINACSPGYIKTDLTAGMGATLPPEAGTKAPLKLLFDPAWPAPGGNGGGSGRYYGSDGVRSPLHRYRGPGDPPYDP